MQKKVIASPLAPKAVGPYSQAIAAGTTLYVSGQLPINAATGLMARGHRGADAAGAREHFGHSRRGGVCAVGCGEDHRPVAGHRGFRRDERRLRHLFHRRAAGARLLRGGASADGVRASRSTPWRSRLDESGLSGRGDSALRSLVRRRRTVGVSSAGGVRTVHLRFGGIARSDSEERFVDSFRELFRFERPVLRFLAFFLTLPQKVIPFTKPI